MPSGRTEGDAPPAARSAAGDGAAPGSDRSGGPIPAPFPARRACTRPRVVAATSLVLGAALLVGTLVSTRGSAAFYLFGFALAATWIIGSVAAGPVTLSAADRGSSRLRLVISGAVLGVAAYGVFVVAALVCRHLPGLGSAVDDLLNTADAGRFWVVLALALANAVAEELFFRGALLDAIDTRHAALWATMAYVIVTAPSGNVALVAAAAVMGSLFMAERLSSGGVLASIVTHATWSTLVLLAFPH